METIQGSLAGRYRLESQIATGGMGSVWLAHDELLNRPVAVKLLSEELTHDVRAAERFRREARTVAQLNHPSMANVFDLVEHEGRPGIVMEYVESETLAARLARNGKLPVGDAIRITDAVLDALDSAHRSGVVHRDVKPGNVLLTTNGEVKVADFGIARSLGDSSLTQTGTIMGTAAYASPEQVRGHPATAQSDLYSTGVLLYEMLTGVRPFAGDTPLATAMARLSEDARPPVEVRPGIGEGINAVVMRALAREPAERFASAEQMRAALMRANDATEILTIGGTDETLALGVATPVREDASEPRRPFLPRPLVRQLALWLAPLVVIAVLFSLIAATGRGSKHPVAPVGPSSPPASASPTQVACCAVPGLIGLSLEDAEIALARSDLTYGTVSEAPSDAEPGTVIDQSAPPGATLDEGASVNLVVAAQPTRKHGKRGKGNG